jgi:hypothetical protein
MSWPREAADGRRIGSYETAGQALHEITCTALEKARDPTGHDPPEVVA